MVRDVPGVGARQAEHHQVAGAQPGHRDIARQHVLRRAELADDRHRPGRRGWPRPAGRPGRHRQDRERLVVSLGRGRPQVVRAPRHHGEHRPVALLDVEHPGHVPAAVRGHGPAGLDPQDLAGGRGPGQAAPVARPVETVARPAVVHGHPAPEVDFRVAHAVPAAPAPREVENPAGRGERRGGAEPARQVRVQPAQPQRAGLRAALAEPPRAAIEKNRVHPERSRRSAHHERRFSPGAQAGIRGVARRVHPEQDVGRPAGRERGGA